MPYDAFVTDLRFAQQASKSVRVTLLNGTDLGLIGVDEVNPDEGWVSFWTPQYGGDDTTRTRVDIDNLATVVLEAVDW